MYSPTGAVIVQTGKLEVAAQYQLVEIRHKVPSVILQVNEAILSGGLSSQGSDVH